MTDLPEDPNRWPRDPFKILNVDRTTDAKSARRAYFKLVRKFKPEKFPVEFQKIREAYDEVETWLKWNLPPRNEMNEAFDQLDVEDSLPLPSADVPEFSDKTRIESDVESMEASGFGIAAFPDPFDQFQESLQRGDVAAAVGFLNQVDPSAGPSQLAKASLTKYHLSKFLPDFVAVEITDSENQDDSISSLDHQRISWLINALDSTEFFQSAIDHLRAEFDQNYRLANCRHFNDFLNRFSDYPNLAVLYRLRWEALGHRDWRIVVADLEELKPRTLEFGDSWNSWVGLLAQSMNYTVWHDDERCRKHNREAWREITESQQSWIADSVELLILAAEEWKTMRSFFEWAPALPWARNSLPSNVRQIWLPVAKSIAVDPSKSLRRLNQLFRSHSIAMSLFEEGLQQLSVLRMEDESIENWEETRELVACYFSKNLQTGYVINRSLMLEFCVLNQLSPISFAHAANSFLDPEATVHWTELVQKDGPLLCVFNSCRAFGVLKIATVLRVTPAGCFHVRESFFISERGFVSNPRDAK